MGSMLWARLLPKTFSWDSLPSTSEDRDQQKRDYCVILGGLSLVLSRVPRQVAQRQYPAAWELRARLRSQRLWGIGFCVEPDLVNEACHEIADITDRHTKDAMLRRLRSGHTAPVDLRH